MHIAAGAAPTGDSRWRPDAARARLSGAPVNAGRGRQPSNRPRATREELPTTGVKGPGDAKASTIMRVQTPSPTAGVRIEIRTKVRMNVQSVDGSSCWACSSSRCWPPGVARTSRCLGRPAIDLRRRVSVEREGASMEYRLLHLMGDVERPTLAVIQSASSFQPLPG